MSDMSPFSEMNGTMPIIMPERTLLVSGMKLIEFPAAVAVVVVVTFEIKLVLVPTVKIEG